MSRWYEGRAGTEKRDLGCKVCKVLTDRDEHGRARGRKYTPWNLTIGVFIPIQFFFLLGSDCAFGNGSDGGCDKECSAEDATTVAEIDIV
jgi:hypothetical protein